MIAGRTLAEVAANAVYDRLAFAARHEGFEIADTTWGNDTGPSFAGRRDACAIRVFVPLDEPGIAHVVGPFSGGPISRADPQMWTARVVELSSDAREAAEYSNEVTSVAELIRLLNRIT